MTTDGSVAALKWFLMSFGHYPIAFDSRHHLTQGLIIKGCFVNNHHNYPDNDPITHCGEEAIKRPKLLARQQDQRLVINFLAPG